MNPENPEYQMLNQDPSPHPRAESPVPSPTVLTLSNDAAGQRMTAGEDEVLGYITLGKSMLENHEVNSVPGGTEAQSRAQIIWVYHP